MSLADVIIIALLAAAVIAIISNRVRKYKNGEST